MTTPHPQHDAPQGEALAALRIEWRKDLLARRGSMLAEARALADQAIGAELGRILEAIDGVLGFYWPIKGEFDARPAVTRWLAGAATRQAALPVVLRRAAPLVFRAWEPHTPMVPAGFGTSVPEPDLRLVPTTLLVPLVGYDAAGYRLGYGGGYYDRTLATLSPRPSTIGIGYALCRLDSIHPQAYDMKLDRLVVA